MPRSVLNMLCLVKFGEEMQSIRMYLNVFPTQRLEVNRQEILALSLQYGR
jgi:hypothetical protein